MSVCRVCLEYFDYGSDIQPPDSCACGENINNHDPIPRRLWGKTLRYRLAKVCFKVGNWLVWDGEW